MGNAQSTGPHHRLSKPKTNTNSPFGTPKVDAPVSVYSQYADLSFKDRHQLKTTLTSPVETEFGTGFSYTEDDSIGDLASHVQVRLSNLSRSNSIISQVGSGRNTGSKLASFQSSNLSLVSQPQGVDLDTAIKILHEVRKNASPEDIAALHQALQTSPSPVSDQGLSRRTSMVNRSSSSLIRRRSLIATPGLATRNSPTDGVRRTWNSWRTPQVQPQVEPTWKVEMMGTSPLTRIAALDPVEDGRESPAPRAQTPGDMDYSHLGSLQLGSLTIANGAPSPAASARNVSRSKSITDLAQEDDYFTASEGTSSPATWKEARKGVHSRSKSSVLPQTPPLYRKQPSNARGTETSQCDSPLKVEAKSADSPYSDLQASLEPLNLDSYGLNQSADALAKDYMAEIPDSPFRKSITAERHDEGFSEPIPDDAASFREEAFRILDGTMFSEPARKEHHDSPCSPTSTSRSSKAYRRRDRRPTPSKADSGYSSGGSFRTPPREATREGANSVLSKKPSLVAEMLKSGSGPDGDDVASLYTFEQMLALPISQKPLPPVPTQDTNEKRPANLLISEISVEQNSPSPSPISSRTTKSAASQWTTESASSAQKRLQKRRPSLQSLPVVQSCQPIEDGTIPQIPDTVRAKFVRRLSEAPEMECLTKTYLSVDHVKAEETTIDSAATVSLNFPSPTSSPAPRGRHHRRSHTERPPTPPPHGSRRSLSLFRRKPECDNQQEGTGVREDNPSLNVVDLGTIGSALGGSPYDIAMSSLPKKVVKSPTHPHQLGNAMPRPKSMANMNERTAAEVARMRSKDRALLRPEMPQRPRSYHDGYNKGQLDAVSTQGYGMARIRPTKVGSEELEPHKLSTKMRDDMPSADGSPGHNFRARSTGRGPLVSQLVEQYDQRVPQAVQPDWEHHARLWSQRRKSVGEGLRQRAEAASGSPLTPYQRASSQPPEEMVIIDRYSGGLNYGYEGRGYGISGSAGTRQLHSAAGRKSLHFNHFGVDLTDVPVFVQRI